MKKFVSFFVAAVCTLTLSAATVTFSGADFTGGTANTGSAFSVTKNGVTVSSDKAYGTGSELRVYQYGTLKVDAGDVNITRISATFGTYTKMEFDDATPNAPTWSIEATKQIRVTELVVTIAGEGGSSEGGDEGDYSYEYEPTVKSNFNITIDYLEASDYTADYGVVYFYLEDETGKYFSELEFIAQSYDSVAGLPTGTYQINSSEDFGTFFASPGGDDDYDYGCYFGVVDDEGYYDPYYIVSGTVTVSSMGWVINGTSYNGSTIKLTYPLAPQAIEKTSVQTGVAKKLHNGQIVIEKNQRRYSLQGQELR